MAFRGAVLRTSVLAYFLLALEVLIMISPFAGFFYAAFNPVLLGLAGSNATRWLTAFYLPHLVLPGDPFLVAVRVAGSVLTVLGLALFLLGAVQVYLAKLLGLGTVTGGLYALVRHPQYLGLEAAGLGLAVLWPRFLTAVLWVVMLGVYALLARDEERRMLAASPGLYRAYQARTGRFLPAGLARAVGLRSPARRGLAVLGLVLLALAAPFLLRAYTVRHLTLWSRGPGLAAVAILPEDGTLMAHRMEDLLALPQVRDRLAPGRAQLVYVLPREYVMQGLIADTGGDWRLYQRHRTLGMITGWVLHPFAHLRGGHHHPAGGAGTAEGPVRRFIFVGVEGAGADPASLFAIDARRRPEFLLDAQVHDLKVLDLQDLPPGSGWGSVPGPIF